LQFIDKADFMLSINNWWHNLEGLEQVFWAIAIIFTILFLIQFVLSIIGLGVDADLDVSGHLDTDLHGDIHPDYSVDPSFTLFSVRSVIAFFTFFGWVGVIALSNGLGTVLALVLATTSGLIAMVFVAVILYQLIKLSEEGTVRIDEALGKYAEVYIPIPEKRNGKGKVIVEFEHRSMELDAITDGHLLPTGTVVYIFKVYDDNVLLVGEVKEKTE